MTNRRILTILLSIFMLTGVVFITIPLLSSFEPSEVAKDKVKLKVDLKGLENDTVTEFKWRGYSVFVVKNSLTQKAFLMPYWEGSYRLPDPAWARAIVPCKTFYYGNDGFSCTDLELPEGWRSSAQWDIDGIIKNKSSWMPNLQVAPYKIKGNYLVVSPEYK